MKKFLLLLVLLIAGLGLGGGAAFATMQIVAPPPPKDEDAGAAFVPTGKVLAPLVFDDGHLAGYVEFEVQLQVPQEKAPSVTARMPLLLHAINMRTYRTPMAAGPDGLLPDLATFRKVVLDASREAFGAHVVRKVAVTSANPA